MDDEERASSPSDVVEEGGRGDEQMQPHAPACHPPCGPVTASNAKTETGKVWVITIDERRTPHSQEAFVGARVVAILAMHRCSSGSFPFVHLSPRCQIGSMMSNNTIAFDWVACRLVISRA
jgi:hypothetical protein